MPHRFEIMRRTFASASHGATFTKKDLKMSHPICKQYDIIRRRLVHTHEPLGPFVTYLRFSTLWAKLVQRAVYHDVEVRTRLVYNAVRHNDINAARILFRQMSYDSKEIFVLDGGGTLERIDMGRQCTLRALTGILGWSIFWSMSSEP